MRDSVCAPSRLELSRSQNQVQTRHLGQNKGWQAGEEAGKTRTSSSSKLLSFLSHPRTYREPQIFVPSREQGIGRGGRRGGVDGHACWCWCLSSALGANVEYRECFPLASAGRGLLFGARRWVPGKARAGKGQAGDDACGGGVVELGVVSVLLYEKEAQREGKGHGQANCALSFSVDRF